MEFTKQSATERGFSDCLGRYASQIDLRANQQVKRPQSFTQRTLDLCSRKRFHFPISTALISVDTMLSAKLRDMRRMAGSSSLKKLRGSLANSYSPHKTKKIFF